MGLERWHRLAQIDANAARFIELLSVLIPAHQGQWVLMRDREAVGFFSTAIDAHIAGNEMFGDGVFSVQRISPAPEEEPEDGVAGDEPLLS